MHNIIIEGPDASGKSTLARYLAEHLRMPIKESEGPPPSLAAFLERAERYSQLQNTIIVRHPHISQFIYGRVRGDYDVYYSNGDFRQSLMLFLTNRPLTIFCEPTILPHHPKDYDTPEHLEMINEKSLTIENFYRSWANEYADLFYSLNRSKTTLIKNIRRLRFDPLDDIRQFHEKFQLDYDGKPRELPKTLKEFRHSFMEEEAFEYGEAETIYDALDALIDLTYIAYGTSYLHGFNHNDIFAEAWRRVHRANMSKVRSESTEEHAGRGSTFDIVKPPGFVPPSLEDLVS
jgi:predicted HAD superfamily Cof-like phosphohydrolase